MWIKKVIIWSKLKLNFIIILPVKVLNNVNKLIKIPKNAWEKMMQSTPMSPYGAFRLVFTILLTSLALWH